MTTGGKLEKLLILAFSDSKKAETGTDKEADLSYEALINPETYVIEHKIRYAEGDQAPGTTGKEVKYDKTEPREMSFEFLLDNTGIIDGKRSGDIAADLVKFKNVLMGYNGDAHQPRLVKLVWGDLAFKGRATELGITYKLFNPDGKPIRALAKVKVKESIEEKKRVAAAGNKSPDLTHVRVVKAGDTLPLMCHRIYGDSRYYPMVARANQMDNMRRLVPGTTVVFPPIDKSAQRT
jgi:hypothetical protein